MKLSLKSFSINVFSQGVVQALIALRALIILPILTKTLGDYYYGVWSQLIVTITLLASVLTLRFDIVFVRFFSAENDRQTLGKAYHSMLSAMFICLVLVGGLFWTFTEDISFFIFKDAGLRSYILILFALLAIRAVFLFSLSYYRSRQKLVLYSGIQGLQIAGEILILFLFIVKSGLTLLDTVKILMVFNLSLIHI